MRLLIPLIVLVTTAASQPLTIEGDRLRAHIRFLSSDLLEGRSVGTRADKLTTEYLASAFAAAGARPAGENGTYFQSVPLTGVTTDPASTISINGKPLRWRSDFVGRTETAESNLQLATPAVFVGHGIHAPEFGWDDYAGMNVKGKIVVLFTGEPASDDPNFFAGKALTYYGRWTYKFEEAARQGAAGAIIIHTDETASYGWSVLENSWGREDIQLRRGDAPALRFAAWMSKPAAMSAGLPVDDLLFKAGQKGFGPSALPFAFELNIRSTIRQFESRNVAARLEGSDPKAGRESILYSAHWDHLGLAPTGEDRVFNGAVDNATGCALLIEIARSWAALNPRPKRSVLLLAVTGEESGLRGSEYFVRHLLLPLNTIKAALNIDSVLPGGKPAGLLLLGAEKTPVWPQVQEAARRFQLPILPDPRPEAGSFFRSDHFSFSRAGIAAFSISGVGIPGEFAQAYNAKRYHQLSDEYSESWDMTANETIGGLALLLGVNIASLP